MNIKKTLILAGILMMTGTIASAQPCPPPPGDFPPPPPCMDKPAPPKIDLDKKLNLTEEQKVKAREIRMQGHEQIRPLMEELQTKQDQKRAVMRSKLTQKDQLETIAALNKDINVLKKKIHEARVQNMKDFEAILTDKQKAKLEKIKQDARKDFKKNHKRGEGPRPCPCK